MPNTENAKHLTEIMNMHHFRKFEKDVRSSFPYWYYHWKAFNLTAFYLGVWKFKYLFHDIEKPWLKLIWDYSKVQKWHRQHNKHHVAYLGGLNKIDWLALIIDNECSRFTKLNAQMSARYYVEYVINEKPNVSEEMRNAYIKNCLPLLEYLGL